MISKRLILFVILALSPWMINAQNWREIRTVKDVCEAYPDKMTSMLEQYDLDYPGLEKVRRAYESGKLARACAHLLKYYEKGNNAGFLRKEPPKKTAQTDARADTILNNVFVVQNVRGQVPFGDDGHRDWYYKGPNNDEEWAWLSNRHSQINYVLSVYFETGNPKYAEYIDLFLRDFIIKSMPYPGVKSSTSVWRGLEVAARAKAWSRIFYGLLNNKHFSDATRLLMLSSLPDHAHYNRRFHSGNNWLTMEISALATVAANFPEYEQSPVWLDYAVETMTESMKKQVYPDGVQTELTSHYHQVALKNFELFKNICDRAGKPLPDFFNQTIEKMYGYMAHTIRPSGDRLLNNDGDKGSDREVMLEAAKTYDHPEWAYLAANGAAGTMPKDGPSYAYPWAGHLVSRSGYDADAHWSFFDIGPWGSGHQHNDMLHLSIAAYGRDLLVDAGRFAYKGAVAEKFRGYARSTRGHNAVVIDGKGQRPGVRVTDEPLSAKHFRIEPAFDFAWNSFDRFYDMEGVQHHRSLFYVRGQFWVVVDKVETREPRKVETLWHWHPDCQVEVLDNGVVRTNNEKGNLRITPVEKADWKVEVVEGQEEPDIQGWYSVEYNKYEPNAATIHTTNIESDAVFVWILQPSEKEAPALQARIQGQDEERVQLTVSDSEGRQWDIEVPFYDSSKAAVVVRNN